jgi:hypothetical protein
MERDWLDELQTHERAEREREIQDAAARNKLISQEAPRIFDKLLACFRSHAANCRVSGVTLRLERPERDLGRLIATVQGRSVPLKTGMNIQLDLDRQEIKCSSEVGGTETFYFGVSYGTNVSLYQDGRLIPQMDTVCATVLRPLLIAAKALH